MKIHRFWLETIPDESDFVLTQHELIHQIKDVLELQPRELIQLFNTKEEKQGELVTVSKHQLAIKIKKDIPQIHTPVKILLAVSLLKGDSWEDIVRGCVALGITDIQPLICERSIVRELTSTKLQRYHTIAQETVEQSGWSEIPTFLPLQHFSSWVESVHPTHTFLLHQAASPITTQVVHQEMTVVVGPEGGWTEAELSLAQHHHLTPVSVSPATLTARLAPVVACAEALALASQK